jgi:hypothetical protein
LVTKKQKLVAKKTKNGYIKRAKQGKMQESLVKMHQAK